MKSISISLTPFLPPPPSFPLSPLTTIALLSQSCIPCQVMYCMYNYALLLFRVNCYGCLKKFFGCTRPTHHYYSMQHIIDLMTWDTGDIERIEQKEGILE